MPTTSSSSSSLSKNVQCEEAKNQNQQQQKQSDCAAVVHQHILRGHRDAVTCLAYSPPCTSISSFLCSGSADQTVRLWDQRTQTVALCILPQNQQQDHQLEPMEITSVAFHPDHHASTSTSSSSVYDYSIFITTNQSQLVEYDLRYIREKKNSSLLIIRDDDSTMDYTNILSISDEINQVSVIAAATSNDRTNPSTFIATADDNGDVHIIQKTTASQPDDPTTSITSTETLVFHHGSGHTNSNDTMAAAMVTSVAFRPMGKKQKQILFASGGTDCTVKLWDIKKNNPLSSYLVTSPSSSSSYDKNNTNTIHQICNPPMIHSISWSSTGNLLATGLGDGTAIVFCCSYENKKNTKNSSNNTIALHSTKRLIGGHSSTIACVHFPSIKTILEDRLLATAGNDGNILFWDIGRNTTTTGHNNNNKQHEQIVDLIPATFCFNLPAELLVVSQQRPHNQRQYTSNSSDTNNKKGGYLSNKKKGKRSSSSNNKEKQGNETTMTKNVTNEGEAKVLLGVPHVKKPNCITSSTSINNCASSNSPLSIFVADTSNDITVYTIPFQ